MVPTIQLPDQDLGASSKVVERFWAFMAMMNGYFGMGLYNMKHMVRYYHGLYSGLERVTKMIGVDWAAERSHQASSDSLLTMHVFLKLNKPYFNRQCK
ncbi:hypothetical protein U1Q18_003738 [Sarracenia purpurea var. burkii]